MTTAGSRCLPVSPGRDGFQIGKRRVGRLIAISRIFAAVVRQVLRVLLVQTAQRRVIPAQAPSCARRVSHRPCLRGTAPRRSGSEIGRRRLSKDPRRSPDHGRSNRPAPAKNRVRYRTVGYALALRHRLAAWDQNPRVWRRQWALPIPRSGWPAECCGAVSDNHAGLEAPNRARAITIASANSNRPEASRCQSDRPGTNSVTSQKQPCSRPAWSTPAR